MLNKEDFNKFNQAIKTKLDETNGALITEELLAAQSAYNGAVDRVNDLNKQIETLKSEKEKLIQVNGRLYQKIGFESIKDTEETKEKPKDKDLTIDDIIDKKGDFK